MCHQFREKKASDKDLFSRLQAWGGAKALAHVNIDRHLKDQQQQQAVPPSPAWVRDRQAAAGGEEASFFIRVFPLFHKFALNCCKTLEKEKFPRPTPTSLG